MLGIAKSYFEVGCRLEQFFTVKKTAEATRKTFVTCTVAALRPEGEKNANSHFPQTHPHTRSSMFWPRIEDAMDDCSATS